MKCPKCKSENVTVQTVAETNTERRGCGMWLVWLVGAVVTCGLILIVPLLTNSRNRSKVKRYATCQSCGHGWVL